MCDLSRLFGLVTASIQRQGRLNEGTMMHKQSKTCLTWEPTVYLACTSIVQYKYLAKNMPAFIVLIKNRINRQAGAFNERTASDRRRCKVFSAALFREVIKAIASKSMIGLSPRQQCWHVYFGNNGFGDLRVPPGG